MRFLASAIAILVFGAVASVAQEVPVRSGAHDGFTRLVVHLPERVPWQLSGADRNRTVSFDQAGMRFDLKAVFARIDGRRLASVKQVPGQSALEISTACDCPIEAFWAGSAMLVIDVRDAGAGAQQAPGAPARSDTATAPATGADRASVARVEFETDLVWTGQTAVPSSTGVVSQGLKRHLSNMSLDEGGRGAPEASGTPVVSDGGDALDVPPALDRDAFRGALAEQIGRAASQGLLEPSETPELPTSQATRDLVTEQADDPVPPEMAVDTGTLTTQLRFDTGFEAGILVDGQGARILETGRVCLEDELLDAGFWASGVDFSTEIGALRKHLVGEFDRLDPDTAQALARTYIHFGFGAEALQILKLGAGAADARETRVLLDMAHVLEQGALERPSSLHGQMACDGPAALWSVLAHPEISQQTDVNDDAVLRTLSAMPRHLRDYLGPIAARRFLAAGRQQTAERVFQILSRDTHEGTQAEQLARAEADLLSDDPAAADEKLTDVVQSNSLLAAEALLRQIETRIATGRGLSEDIANLASAYAVEHRESPIGEDLTRASIAALAASGDFDSAFAERTRQRARLGTEADVALSNTLYALLVGNAADITFLTHGFAASDAVVAVLTPETGNAIAQRALALGFPEVSRRFVSQETAGELQVERRLIRAEIALAQGQPRRAQIALLGLSGDDVNRLRDRSRSMIGQKDMARDLPVDADDPAAPDRQPEPKVDWSRFAQSGEEDIARLAGLLGEDSFAEADPDAPLAQGRALLEASLQSRETVRAVLENRPAPAAE